jgi:hypothetical protein
MRSTDSSRGEREARISGLLVRRRAWMPLRILAVITGLALVRGLLVLAGRYLLALRRTAVARVEGDTISIEEAWTICQKRFRRARTVSPVFDVDAARFERRWRHVHLVIGFGCLTVGTWLGIQWLVDGLRSGYPYLALVGAAVVAAGVAVDLLVYLVVPEGRGRSRVTLAIGPWRVLIAGVDPEAGERFVEALRKSWRGPTPPSRESR